MDKNPFRPGSGRMPPLLAGRDAVKDDINGLLQYLNEPSSGAPRDIILYGPRGNGKTVLLQWFKNNCNAGAGYTVLRITPSSSRSLKDQVMDGLGTTQAQVTTERSGSLGVKFLKAVGKRSVVKSSQAEPLVSYLIQQARQNPLVLLVDEAHTMPADWGRELLNASQEVREEAPFLMVLAGTPGLKDRLGSMEATFWIRSKKIPLGRLDASAAADAILTPLHTEGISLAPDVLTQVVAASQHYPFFIQLWGAILWETAKKTECTQIDQALLDEAWGAFNYEKGLLYQDCFDDITKKGVESAALAVANAFGARGEITTSELRNIVAGRPVNLDPPKEVLATISALRELGYVWQGSEKSDWEPGIPSLMTYVQTEAQKLTPDNSGDFSPGM
ncbi:MAG: AAA family ATPase [Gammaproteobacteria bacterium]|nr:AAA family ATPase [Gammaproteobacteria bacterium]